LLREIIPLMAQKGCGHREAITEELGYPWHGDEEGQGERDRLPYRASS
jgi:hypothetical protein